MTKKNHGHARNAWRASLATAFFLALAASGAASEDQTGTAARNDANDRRYDLVINGGRVIDPESGLDAPRSLGIASGKVVAISQTPLHGRESIDATGLIVSPGFIDLHSHAQQFAGARIRRWTE